jgi:MFS transporter, YQGE family, putative transporter
VLRLSLSQMLFSAIYHFSNLFINAYLFKESQDVQVVAYYNFFLFTSWGICFYLGFKICELNTRVAHALSGVTCLIGVLLLIFGVQNFFWLGLFMGATGGFFWTSYLSTYRLLGKNSENGETFARVSLLSSVITVFIPIFFGYIVEGASYFVGFIVLFILSILIICVSFFLPALSTEKIKLKKKSFQHPTFIFSNVLQGFYFSFVGIAAGLLIFMEGNSEAKVGAFATYFGMVTVLVTFLIAYVLPSKIQKGLLIGSSILYLLSSTLFLSDWNSTIIIFNFILAFAGPCFSNPNVGLNFAYINHQFDNGEEGLLVREFGLNIGRLLFFGYMAVYGINVHSLSFYIFLFIASSFPLFISLAIQKWKWYQSIKETTA